MAQYGAYLVCNEHIDDVEAFLTQFFKKVEDGYTFSGWRTLFIPGVEFVVNLMAGEDGEKQELTQNVTFELYCDTYDELKSYAEKYDVNIESFDATSAPEKYRYHFIEIPGPQNICKIEVSYTENL